MHLSVPAKLRRLCAAALFLGALGLVARGQSARPGWGSVPYQSASGNGVTFRVWAPNATSVYVPGEFNGWSTTSAPLAKEITNGTWNGVWSADVSVASTGQQYKYFINYSGGSVWKHDPRARKVVNSSSNPGANDIIYDPAAFNWAGDSSVVRPLEDLFIYELHIGTFYDPSPSNGLSAFFTDATNRLDYVKSLGASAVEVLPISEFPGNSSWGYNPADLFAADNAAYGGPDGFKAFVKAAHQRGLAVLVDVVHNHYGPTDLDLWDFDGWDGGGNGGGIYFYQDANLGATAYGPKPNFNRQPVRDFITDNFRLWLEECHVDGFRWDTPGLMLTANDGSYINDAATLITSITSMMRSNYPGKVNIAEDRMGYGFDSTWDTTFPYAVTPVLDNSVDQNRDMTVIANALTNNVRFNVTSGLNRVVFLESHDVVGDLNHGTRLPTAIDSSNPASYWARKRSTLGAVATFTAPGIPMLFQGQDMLENQQFSASRPVDWSKTNTFSAIVQFYHDLIRLRRNLDDVSLGLKGDQCTLLQVDNVNKLVAYRRWKTAFPNQDVVVVANFANATRTNYDINFPRGGAWYVRMNSDSTQYGADYSNVGSSVVSAQGAGAAGAVTIGPYSTMILSQAAYPPTLFAQTTNGRVAVSWPIAFADWELDSASGLAGASWTPVPTSQYQTNQQSVFISAGTAGTVFYRLRHP